MSSYWGSLATSALTQMRTHHPSPLLPKAHRALKPVSSLRSHIQAPLWTTSRTAKTSSKAPRHSPIDVVQTGSPLPFGSLPKGSETAKSEEIGNAPPPKGLEPAISSRWVDAPPLGSLPKGLGPSFGKGMIYNKEEPPERAQKPSDISLRPLFVALGICFGSFCVADVLDRKSDTRINRILEEMGWRRGARVSMGDVTRLEEKEAIQRTEALLDRFHSRHVIKEMCVGLKSWWVRRNDGERATYILIAFNVGVFLSWKVIMSSRSPPLMMRMMQSFIHTPGSSVRSWHEPRNAVSYRSPGYTLLTSVFSHQGAFHLTFNMIGLLSFGPLAFNYLKTRRIFDYPNFDESGFMNIHSTYHHIAFFMTCGVVANLIPHYIRLLATSFPALLKTTIGKGLIPGPGLGASGAVYSCLVICALYRPDLSVALIFLPMVPFKIGVGVPVMVLADAFGVLRGWRSLDHLCHLTGAAFGLGSYLYGAKAWFWAQWLLHGGRLKSSR